ncbi:MAG TPA: DUF2269 family protein [Actinomycetota bacterium]|nr:DUF2269 family protein [Actinomycetota bacterium]
MDFVGNDAWFTVLLVLHVVGAVIGLGPTFAYSVLGPLSAKSGPEGGLALMEGMQKIEDRIVNPILLTMQPLTGVGLIFNRGLNNDFFASDKLWLIGGISAYAVATYIALAIANPTQKRMIALAKSGDAATPAFGALATKMSKVGPVLAMLGVVVVVLMAWKPGGNCGPLIRC